MQGVQFLSLEAEMKNSYQKFLAIMFLVSLLLLAACGGEAGGPSTPSSAGAATPTSPPTVQSTSPPTSTPPLGGLSPTEVQSWCTEVKPGSGACDASNFTQLQEDNGAINPKGVHFKATAPAKFNVPVGISVDVWDCFKPSQATGPVVLPQVCEASFRK